MVTGGPGKTGKLIKEMCLVPSDCVLVPEGLGSSLTGTSNPHPGHLSPNERHSTVGDPGSKQCKQGHPPYPPRYPIPSVLDTD